MRSCSLVFLLVMACGNTDTGGDDDEPGPDGGSPGSCTSAAECAAEVPICNPDGICVQCMTSADCSADAPICGNGSCEAACAGDQVSANFVTVPSDIIWVVDQSGSMDQETDHVQAQINNFAALIDQSNIDYRVVMIAATGGSNSICVPSPLGGASCGNNTRFRLVNQRIGSHDALSQTISRYSLYSDFLRPEAMKHFVYVTDDNSSVTAASFTTSLEALQPAGMFANRTIHGIYAFGNGTNGCDGAFGSGAAEGTVYSTLISQTGGASGVICDDDWTQVFDDITQAVISGSQVSCAIAVPAAPEGQTLDPDLVNVNYFMAGQPPAVTLPRVQTAGDCGAAGGWYYDDNVAPTTITLCPESCASIQQDPGANVKLELGCASDLF